MACCTAASPSLRESVLACCISLGPSLTTDTMAVNTFWDIGFVKPLAHMLGRHTQGDPLAYGKDRIHCEDHHRRKKDTDLGLQHLLLELQSQKLRQVKLARQQNDEMHPGGMSMATAWDDEDFFRYCPPSRCSKHGPEIRFPFRLESSNTSTLCGAPGMKLTCSDQDTILVHPFIVTAIDYRLNTLTFVPRVDSSASCRKKLMSASLPHRIVDRPPLRNLLYAVIVHMSK
nr:unnamed protein product [Digitaria exilis]